MSSAVTMGGATTRPPRPSAVVGMIGAGQLARMTHRAAIDLGVELRVLATGGDDPAVLAGARAVTGAPHDLDALRRFAEGCDVVTFDHEQVPHEHLLALEADGVRLAPGAAAKRLAQDKLHARRTLAAAGFPVPPFAHVHGLPAVLAFAAAHGWPVVAKAPLGGYDGRGVWVLANAREAGRVLAIAPDGLLLEPLLDLQDEVAVLVARSPSGQLAVYPAVQTVQREAMCRELVLPASLDDELTSEALRLAAAIAEHAGSVGIMAVELFLTATGLLVNELALRPHNAGHWTIEGAETSQFEQHLRAVLDLPLGPTTARAPAVVTVNVVGTAAGGDPVGRVREALGVAGAHVHLYGKTQRPGRKLGHVTACAEDVEIARRTARRAAALLEGEA